MKLPGAERAVVDPLKVRDYLLSPEHPVGRAKARFFGALGFTRTGWPALQRALLELALRGEATQAQQTRYGQKYEIRDTIQGPTEREAPIVTIWIVLAGEDFPRFVTAYPGDAR